MIISIEGEKTSYKMQHKLRIRHLQQVGVECISFNTIKAIQDKHTANIILNTEKLKSFSLRSATRQRCSLSPLYCNIVLEVLAIMIREEKEVKEIQQENKSLKISLFAKDMTLYISQSVSSVAQSCPTLCDPMNCSTPGLPVHNQLLEFTQTHAHRVSDAIQPSHPLSSPSPPAPDPSQHLGLLK